MKTQQSVKKTVMQILYDYLLLDMPHPVAAKRKVANEIIELFDQQTIKLKLINEKQGELIEAYQTLQRYTSMDESLNLSEERLYDKLKEKLSNLESQLQSLKEGKEKEEDPKMKDWSYTDWNCIDPVKDLYGNVNCKLLIDPRTCGREISCSICTNYKHFKK